MIRFVYTYVYFFFLHLKSNASSRCLIHCKSLKEKMKNSICLTKNVKRIDKCVRTLVRYPAFANTVIKTRRTYIFCGKKINEIRLNAQNMVRYRVPTRLEYTLWWGGGREEESCKYFARREHFFRWRNKDVFFSCSVQDRRKYSWDFETIKTVDNKCQIQPLGHC